MTTIDRRRLLESLGALIGLAVLPGEALAATAGKARLLDRPHTALVTALADTLIPRTDTPGAVQAGVPARFDAMLRDWASPAHRAQHLAALAALDTAAKAKTGRAFAALPAAQRKVFLTTYDAENFAANPAYTKLKELLVHLYYLSEAGATLELRYEHTPGAWEASIPLTPKTRAWSGATFG